MIAVVCQPLTLPVDSQEGVSFRSKLPKMMVRPQRHPQPLGMGNWFSGSLFRQSAGGKAIANFAQLLVNGEIDRLGNEMN